MTRAAPFQALPACHRRCSPTSCTQPGASIPREMPRRCRAASQPVRSPRVVMRAAPPEPHGVCDCYSAGRRATSAVRSLLLPGARGSHLHCRLWGRLAAPAPHVPWRGAARQQQWVRAFARCLWVRPRSQAALYRGASFLSSASRTRAWLADRALTLYWPARYSAASLPTRCARSAACVERAWETVPATLEISARSPPADSETCAPTVDPKRPASCDSGARPGCGPPGPFKLRSSTLIPSPRYGPTSHIRRGTNARILQRPAHRLQRAAMHLRNPAFIHTHHATDFLHRHVLAVVQPDDLLVPLRKIIDQPVQHLAQLALRADVIGVGFRAAGGIRDLAAVACRRLRGVCAAQRQA